MTQPTPATTELAAIQQQQRPAWWLEAIDAISEALGRANISVGPSEILDAVLAALRDSGWVDPDEAAKRQQATDEYLAGADRQTAYYREMAVERGLIIEEAEAKCAGLAGELEKAREDAAVFSAAATALGKDNDRLGDERDALLPVVEAARAWRAQHRTPGSPERRAPMGADGWVRGSTMDDAEALGRAKGYVEGQRWAITSLRQIAADIDACGGNYSGVLFREAAAALEEKLAKEGSDGER